MVAEVEEKKVALKRTEEAKAPWGFSDLAQFAAKTPTAVPEPIRSEPEYEECVKISARASTIEDLGNHMAWKRQQHQLAELAIAAEITDAARRAREQVAASRRADPAIHASATRSSRFVLHGVHSGVAHFTC